MVGPAHDAIRYHRFPARVSANGMSEQVGVEFPNGVLVSSDAGTPSALEGGDWVEALEFDAVL